MKAKKAKTAARAGKKGQGQSDLNLRARHVKHVKGGAAPVKFMQIGDIKGESTDKVH